MTHLKDIPRTKHYAVLTKRVDNIFQYRDAYGESVFNTEEFVEYHAFETEDEVLDFIKFNKPSVYRVIEVRPVEVRTHLSLESVDD